MDKHQASSIKHQASSIKHQATRFNWVIPLLLILPLIFFSCEKDEIERDTPDNETTSNHIFPAEMRAESSASSFARFPPRDLYKDVLIKLYSDSTFQADYQLMVQDFGHPRINFATIDVSSPTEYVLTLPLVKDGDITAFIFYFAGETYWHFTFAPVSLGFELLSQSVNDDFEPVPFLTLIKYNTYQLNRYSRYFSSINNWLIDYNDNNQISSSATERTVWIEVGYQTSGGYDLEELLVEVIWQTETFIIPCGGGVSTGGGGFSPAKPQGEGDGGLPPLGGGGTPTVTPPDGGNDISSSLDPYDISDDCFHYAFTEEAILKLRDLDNANIYDCNSGKTKEEILEDILNELCEEVEVLTDLGEGGFDLTDFEWDFTTLTEDDVNNAMGEEDYVIYNHLKTSCPKLHCIVDHLMSSDPGEALCPDFIMDILSPFIDDGKLHLHINSAEFIGDKEGANGFTTLNFGEGDNPMANVYITMEEAHCTNSNSINLYETFLHELIHADIKRRLIVDFGLTNVDDIDDLFQELLEEMGYDGNNWDNEHQLMLEHYLSGMVEALYLANGGIGDKDAYYGFILNGFGSTPDYLYDWAKNWRPNDFESDQDVTNFINSQMSFFDDQNNIHSNFDLCDD